VEAGAGGGLFGVVALEGLKFQAGSILGATEGGLVDHSVASGLDVVDTTTDVVVATDLDFLGGVGTGVVLATHLVLERGLSLDPGASEFTLDASLALTSNGAYVVLVGVDGAFEDDIIVRVTIAVVQTFSVGDASAGLQREGLASALAAVEPEFAVFHRFAGGQSFAVLDASGLGQLGTTADGLLTFVDTVVLGRLLLQRDAFAAIDASLSDGDQSGLGAGGVGLANVESIAIVECLPSLVLLTVGDATGGLEGQRVAGVGARTTVVGVVVVTADGDAGKIFGDASLGNDAAALAHVDQTTALDFRAFGVTARTSAPGLGREGHRDGREAQDQQSNQLHDDDD